MALMPFGFGWPIRAQVSLHFSLCFVPKLHIRSSASRVQTCRCWTTQGPRFCRGPGGGGSQVVSGQNDLAGKLSPVRLLGQMGSDDSAADVHEDGWETKLRNCQTSKRELGIGRRNKTEMTFRYAVKSASGTRTKSTPAPNKQISHRYKGRDEGRRELWVEHTLKLSCACSKIERHLNDFRPENFFHQCYCAFLCRSP